MPQSVLKSSAGSTTNSNGQIFGSSMYLEPHSAKLLGEAQFHDFAPCPAICCLSCVPEEARKRYYLRIYENRLEVNNLCFPCLCCSKERCIVDDSRNFFFDQPPSRSGMCCFFIPCTCCGPPVIFNIVPRACCGVIDVRPCFGETIMVAPCNCYDLKTCICVGPPCYEYLALPLAFGVQYGEDFVAKWRGALETYVRRTGIPQDQHARFRHVVDKVCDCDLAQEVEAIIPQPITGPMQMDRGDGLLPSIQTVERQSPLGSPDSHNVTSAQIMTIEPNTPVELPFQEEKKDESHAKKSKIGNKKTKTKKKKLSSEGASKSTKTHPKEESTTESNKKSSKKKKPKKSKSENQEKQNK